MLVWVLNSQPSSILEQLANTNFEHFSIQLVEVAAHALPYGFSSHLPGEEGNTQGYRLSLRVSLCRHLNIAIGCFRVLMNGEEMVLNLFEYDGIVIDHTAVAADLHRRIWHQQILSLMAIEIVDPAFLILVTATEITGHDPHWGSPRVRGSTNFGGRGIYTVMSTT